MAKPTTITAPPSPETHVVLRPFEGPAGRYQPGQKVNASDWRTAASLESQRFIRRLGLGDLAPSPEA